MFCNYSLFAKIMCSLAFLSNALRWYAWWSLVGNRSRLLATCHEFWRGVANLERTKSQEIGDRECFVLEWVDFAHHESSRATEWPNYGERLRIPKASEKQQPPRGAKSIQCFIRLQAKGTKPFLFSHFLHKSDTFSCRQLYSTYPGSQITQCR